MKDFVQIQFELRERAFTNELKGNALQLDVEFQALEFKIERDMIYKNGGIMGITVELNDHNKPILSKFIKDYKAYNELVDMEFDVPKEENSIDLISIIDYVSKIHRDTLHYDVEGEFFYYYDLFN